MGLRHYYSFGPPGSGLPPGFDPSNFLPAHAFGSGADETFGHTMASPAFGQDVTEVTAGVTFLDERSLLELEFGMGRGTIWDEDMAKAASDSGIGIVLPEVRFKNSLVSGVNAGSDVLRMNGLVIVNGRLTTDNQEDIYRVYLEAGQFLTIEVMSVVLEFTIIEPIDTFVLLVDPSGAIVVGQNDDEFESFDSLLLDYPVTETGTYFVLITSLFGNIQGINEGGYYVFLYSADPANIKLNTPEPTPAPTQEPTQEPTRNPTQEPTRNPTKAPTRNPTQEPTRNPTKAPTEAPTAAPTPEPAADEPDDPFYFQIPVFGPVFGPVIQAVLDFIFGLWPF